MLDIDESQARQPQWDFTAYEVRPAYLRELTGCMRINELVRKSVVFLGVVTPTGEFVPYGTGFLAVWTQGDPILNFTHLVTAQHVLDDIRETKLPMRLRVNTKDGRAVLANCGGPEHWHQHPTKCDVAVALCNISSDTFDVLYAPLNDGCLTEKYIEDNDIGCGDEVFTAGLFVRHFGSARNLPVVRIGNIASMPEEPVDLDSYGRHHVYLIESRSVGGMSGSPVLLNSPSHRVIKGEIVAVDGHQRAYLMGVNIGLFKTKATADQLPSEPLAHRQEFLDSMSSGIAAVVPIQRVLEIIHLPYLVEQRELAMKKRASEASFVPTSAVARARDEGKDASEAPKSSEHKEAFNSLVSAAAKTKKQDG